MKSLKFTPALIALLARGTKTVTWRLFDDKDLTSGDEVQLIDSSTRQVQGTACIGSVRVRTLHDVWKHDTTGHETFRNEADMLATYRTYYGDRVTPETEVKVVNLVDIHIVPNPVPHHATL
jgi:hypothetical protein